MHISTLGLDSQKGEREGVKGSGEFKLMCYLFYNSNSINDFIDPVLYSQSNGI